MVLVTSYIKISFFYINNLILCVISKHYSNNLSSFIPQLQEVRRALSVTERRFGSPSGAVSRLLFFLETSCDCKTFLSPELHEEDLSNYST